MLRPKRCYPDVVKTDWKGLRRACSAGLLSLALFPWSCQRPSAPTPVAPPPPPPPNYLELGDRSFDAADYPAAAEAYRVYLRDNSSAPDRDRALFRLALAHALPGSPINDPPQAAALLRELQNSFPQSPFRPQADLLLRLQDEVERLRLQWQADAEQLRAEIMLREERIGALTQEVEQLQQGELEKLRSDLTQREERIRQLTAELEKLKQIDMERRPTTPPR